MSKAHARGSVWSGLVSLVLLAVLAMTSSQAAHAQAPGTDREEEARAHFRLSQSHYELGHFAEAAAELERAYALSPRPDLLYNLYVARRDAGELAAAASALRQYLDEGEHIENAALLRHRLAALEAQLAAGDASVGTEADDDDAPGDAEIAAQDAEEPSAPIEAGAARSTEAAVPVETSRSPSPVGYAVLGVGSAAIVAGLVTGGLALDRYGALEASCGVDHGCPPGSEGARDEGLALATSTDALLLGGGVIAAVGVVLLFTVLDEAPSPPPVSAACDGDGCRAACSLSF